MKSLKKTKSVGDFDTSYKFERPTPIYNKGKATANLGSTMGIGHSSNESRPKTSIGKMKKPKVYGTTI